MKIDIKTIVGLVDTAEELTDKVERFAAAVETVAVATSQAVDTITDAVERAAREFDRTPTTEHIVSKEELFRDAVERKLVTSFVYAPPDSVPGNKIRRHIAPTYVTASSVTGVDLELEAKGQQAIRQFRFDRIQGDVKVDG